MYCWTELVLALGALVQVDIIPSARLPIPALTEDRQEVLFFPRYKQRASLVGLVATEDGHQCGGASSAVSTLRCSKTRTTAGSLSQQIPTRLPIPWNRVKS